MRKTIIAGILAGIILQTITFSTTQAVTKSERHQPAVCPRVCDTLIKAATDELTKKNVNCDEKTQERVVVTPGATMDSTSIEMKLDIVNNTKNTVTINYTSGQKFDFVLLDGNRNELYKWSDGKAFTMALQSKKIRAGESVKYRASLSGDSYNTIKDKIVYLKAYITGKAYPFKVNTDGYEIELK